MKKMSRLRWMVLAMAGACAAPSWAQEFEIGNFAAVGAGTVTIKKIRTGWDAEQFAIETKEPIVNPAGCSAPDAYVAHATRAGYKEHYAIALSAMYAGRPIHVVVSDNDCISSRPRIMGIHAAP
jgi:hypothetical protein